jgi:hypothetical protein
MSIVDEECDSDVATNFALGVTASRSLRRIYELILTRPRMLGKFFSLHVVSLIARLLHDFFAEIKMWYTTN